MFFCSWFNRCVWLHAALEYCQWQLPPLDPLSNRSEIMFNQLSNDKGAPVLGWLCMCSPFVFVHFDFDEDTVVLKSHFAQLKAENQSVCSSMFFHPKMLMLYAINVISSFVLAWK